MGAYEDRAFLIWSLSGSGLGTTINAAGNSGNWAIPGQNSDYFTPVNLGPFTDLALLVHCGTPTGTTPGLVVQVDMYDDQGNLYPQVMKTASITAAGSAAPVYAGLRGGAAGIYVVFTTWGRVSWSLTGTSPVFPGVEIQLLGR